MNIVSLRTYHQTKTTSGVYVDGEFFSYSLEDAGRPAGVKVQNETCIPEMTCQVLITHSKRFGKPMMILFNKESDHSIRRHGVKFTGIRCHAGVTIEHTAGCPLIKNYEQLQELVQDAIERGEVVYWTFSEDIHQ